MLRAFQWDLARQVERLDWLLAQLPRYADWGYNELYLHLEDAVEYPSFPEIARRDAYSHRQMRRLVSAAARVGINVVPIVNLLGHTQYLIKTRSLRELNELRAPDGSPLDRGQICPVHPRTLEVAAKLLRDVAPFCTAGKVHVGLDESFHLGQHPLSRREIARIGLAAHFARYVGRLRDLTRSQGLSMGMWADMLYFLPDAIPLLPTDIAAYEWYYYAFQRRPRVELFNFAESNVGEKLVARGIEYWGCPMNGAFRFEPLPHFTDRLENILSWWRRCQALHASGMLVTSWEPYRLAIELTTVIDAAAASLWLDGIEKPRAMLERGFARVFGKALTLGGPKAPVEQRNLLGLGMTSDFKAASRGTGTRAALNMRHPDRGTMGRYVQARTYPATYSLAERHQAKAAAKVALACDRYPFSGYPRWEINSRWDVISRREPLAPYRVEERFFRKLAETARAEGIPEPLRLSVELRWHLAVRDVWVRDAQRTSADVRLAPGKAGRQPMPRNSPDPDALRRGLRAARAMWTRTRNRKVRGPNEQILLADLGRLKAWRRGEPVFGPPWQLCYRVENIAPAVQLVAVEQLRPDGIWETKQACHTIEFQGRAAKPRAGLTREHAAPIDWTGDPARFPVLRFVVRGPGQVRISGVELFGSTRRWLASPSSFRVRHLELFEPSLAIDALQRESLLEITFRAQGRPNEMGEIGRPNHRRAQAVVTRIRKFLPS